MRSGAANLAALKENFQPSWIGAGKKGTLAARKTALLYFSSGRLKIGEVKKAPSRAATSPLLGGYATLRVPISAT